MNDIHVMKCLFCANQMTFSLSGQNVRYCPNHTEIIEYVLHSGRIKNGFNDLTLKYHFDTKNFIVIDLFFDRTTLQIGHKLIKISCANLISPEEANHKIPLLLSFM